MIVNQPESANELRPFFPFLFVSHLSCVPSFLPILAQQSHFSESHFHKHTKLPHDQSIQWQQM